MSPILQLLVILCIILVAAKGSGLITVRIGQPAVLGELAIGVILGPTLIDIFGLPFIEDHVVEETVHFMAELGVIFLMFLAGLETDLEEVNKVRRVAILAGTFGVVFPIVFGTLAALPFDFTVKESLFIGIILSATSVSISARTLMELGVLQGRQGVSTLAAAVIDDVLVILVLSFFIAFAVDEGDSGDGAGAVDVIVIVARVGLFFGVAMLVGLFLLPAFTRWVSRTSTSQGTITGAIIVTLLGAWFAEYVGEVALITGAFMAGIFLGRTEVRREIEEKMHTISYGFFVPVFFVGVGLQADASGFEASDVLLLAVIGVVAAASKLIGSGLGALLAGETLRSSIQVGTGMISRGEVGLIVASVGLSQGLIDQSGFSVMVLTVLITTLITPIALRIVFAQPKEAQHVQHGDTGDARHDEA